MTTSGGNDECEGEMGLPTDVNIWEGWDDLWDVEGFKLDESNVGGSHTESAVRNSNKFNVNSVKRFVIEKKKPYQKYVEHSSIRFPGELHNLRLLESSITTWARRHLYSFKISTCSLNLEPREFNCRVRDTEKLFRPQLDFEVGLAAYWWGRQRNIAVETTRFQKLLKYYECI